MKLLLVFLICFFGSAFADDTKLTASEEKVIEEIIEEEIEEELEGFAAFGTLEIVCACVVSVITIVIAVFCGVMLYVKYQKQKKENPHMFESRQTEDILVSKTVRNEKTDEENH